MKLIGKILLGIILLVVIAAVLVLGFLGFIPGVSALFGANKPRDLGVKYTEADLQEIRTKTQVKYLVLPDTQEPISTRQFSGRPRNPFQPASSPAVALSPAILVQPS